MIVQVVVTDGRDNDVADAGIVPFKSFHEAMTFATKAAEVNDPETMEQARKDTRDDSGTCDAYDLLERFNDLSWITIRVIKGWNSSRYMLQEPTNHADIETQDHPIPFADGK